MYQVQWRKSVLIDLAHEWSQAEPAFGKAIRDACDAIDNLLKSEPSAHGESRPHDRRILFYAPLAVIYKIDGEAKTVSILHARVMRKRSK